KKRRKYPSFTLKQAGWKYLGGNRIRIGNRVHKFALSRPIEGAVKTVTIKRDRAGRLWLFLSVVDESLYPEPHEAVTRPVGMDFGLATFLTLSDGHEVASPEFFRRSLNEVRAANRDLSRKRKGSNNREKARIRLAKTYDRVSNRRR